MKRITIRLDDEGISLVTEDEDGFPLDPPMALGLLAMANGMVLMDAFQGNLGNPPTVRLIDPEDK